MNPNDEGIRSLNQDEHVADAHAKQVVVKQWDGSGWVRESGGLLAGVAYDDIVFSNEDANANPQTATVKLSGNTVRVLGMTYNSSSKLTRIYKVS